PDALLIRLADVEFFTLVVYRCTIGGLLMLAGYSLYCGRDFVRQILMIGVWGLVVVVLEGGSSWTFYLALERTTVANVLVIFASTPLIAALLTRIFLDDVIERPTWLAIWSAGLGLVVVASGGVTTGNWLGDLLALINAVVIAGVYTVIRRRRDLNMIPAAGLGLLLAAFVAYPFAQFPSLGLHQWLILVIGASVVLPVALALVTLGPRYLPVPEVAMLTLLETIIGPVWVWLVIGEEPGIRTLLGGSVVVTALFFHALWRFRKTRQDASSLP
ncbi:MAG TPA: DMT family transporter, partial [Gammaproteobacteria bacterium]|nr:DMT family transporter [Gammaproteobacteria bacterium]